jgi:hypothetical protein
MKNRLEHPSLKSQFFRGFAAVLQGFSGFLGFADFYETLEEGNS